MSEGSEDSEEEDYENNTQFWSKPDDSAPTEVREVDMGKGRP